MPETLFIADLHLDSKKPFFIELCLDFLAGRARQADALYILGDLFEVWLGDDNDEPAYKPVLAALHNLTQSGIPVFIILCLCTVIRFVHWIQIINHFVAKCVIPVGSGIFLNSPWRSGANWLHKLERLVKLGHK